MQIIMIDIEGKHIIAIIIIDNIGKMAWSQFPKLNYKMSMSVSWVCVSHMLTYLCMPVKMLFF